SRPRALHSFPTRRSSDLRVPACGAVRAVRGAGGLRRDERRQGAPGPVHGAGAIDAGVSGSGPADEVAGTTRGMLIAIPEDEWTRSEEHTSELQSRGHLVC